MLFMHLTSSGAFCVRVILSTTDLHQGFEANNNQGIEVTSRTANVLGHNWLSKPAYSSQVLYDRLPTLCKGLAWGIKQLNRK